ncbi:MAG: Rpn family recombination-promoting nuclease/putative transposase [Planctomycetia bacterium]|nr:Rpn family recombination-promoting nuclease/putative transposase [Planctomycetia bacterium]
MSETNFEVLPTQDVFIHYLFTSEGSEGVLLSFVNAVLADAGRPLVEKIYIKNTFNPQRFTEDKWFINDIKGVDEEGNVYEIEIQTLNHESFENRILYYWGREYSNQLVKGEDYRRLNPVIGIAVTRFLLFPDLEKPHNEFYITCKQNPNYILTDDLQLHFIELADEKWHKMSQMFPAMCDWLQFLAKANEKTEEEMEVLLKKNKDVGIRDAYKKYQKFCETPELRQLAEERWLADVYKRTLLGEARDKGIREGLEKGREEGREEERLKNLLKILQVRFGEIPKDVLQKLKFSENDWDTLLTESITCHTLEEFRERLK